MSWWKDPLWFFLFAGAILLAASNWFTKEDADYQIDVSQSDLNRLNDQWMAQMRRPPTEEELTGLIESFVKEEIYYREAKRIGLDENDTIVRRRLVQKLTFLTEDVATALPPSEDEVASHYAENLSKYTLPPRITFRHRYFSVDRREDAKADAEAAREDEAANGDPFMLQKAYAERSEREVADLFGRSFAAELFGMKHPEGTGTWSSPIRSAYGWHLVLVEKTTPEETLPLSTVSDRVVADLKMQKRKEANETFFSELRSRYVVNTDAP